MNVYRFTFLLCLAVSRSVSAQPFDPVLSVKLQQKIDSMRLANNIKGISAGVYYPGMGTWQGVSGLSHPGTPITTDMEFAIGSNTKLFTGVLLLKLAEQQLIGLDDSLYRYLPTLNNLDSTITIRQLLNHTSGIADVTTVPGYPDSILNDPTRVFTPGELLTWLGPPLFAPGTGWSYCNTNYLLAGMIAENVTGLSYGQLLRDSLLVPLQLDSTFLDVYDSVLYTIAQPWQAGVNNSAVPRIALNSAAGAAGAMYSTAGEMLQWYTALMNGQVLQPSSFQAMTTFVGTGNYGIGISEAVFSGRTVWLHGGTIWGGYNSTMLYDTTSGIIVCVLTNQLPAQALPVAVQLLATAVSGSPTGFSENGESNTYLMVYPNPANEKVTIDLGSQPLFGIEIYTASGKLVKTANEPGFFVSDLPAGMYFIRAVTEQGVRLYRFIREQ